MILYKTKNSGNQPEFNHQSKNEQLLNCWYILYFKKYVLSLLGLQNTNYILNVKMLNTKIFVLKQLAQIRF